MDRPHPRAPGLTDAELQRITIICRAIARRKIHLFNRLPSISLDDLLQAALTGASNRSIGGALRAHQNYNPASRPAGVKESYNGCIGRAASNAILDLYKTVSREYARANNHTPADLDYGVYPTFANGVPESLPEFPARLNRQLGARAGRLGHPPAAYVAALVYREQRGLSWRAFWLKLKTDPALVRMFGFSSCPALSRLLSAVSRLKRWAEEESAAAAE